MNYDQMISDLKLILKYARESRSRYALRMNCWTVFRGEAETTPHNALVKGRRDRDRLDSVNQCGTAGCLVGSLAAFGFAEPRVQELFDGCDSYMSLASDDICQGWLNLSNFLFMSRHLQDQGGLRFPSNEHVNYLCADAQELRADDAIARLEKTIAYLEMKRKIWNEDPEKLRRQEGDWNFVKKAQDAHVAV